MQSGHLLRNRYRIENRLSAGGFGETYIAIDEDYPDKRRVVVKHLKPQNTNPGVLEFARRLFENEGVTLAKLGEKTDLIPTLYAYFEEDREFYLVQEFIEGQTLTQELGTRRLSESEKIAIVREILVVLTEVHRQRIVHRDLKPDNIIRRSRDRQLVLIDFGAVKEVRHTNLQISNAPIAKSIGIGTTGYMPSEQAMGYPNAMESIVAIDLLAQTVMPTANPVASTIIMPVPKGAKVAAQTPSPTYIPPVSANSSSANIQAPPQPQQALANKQIDQSKLLKWAVPIGAGLVSLFLLSRLFTPPTPKTASIQPKKVSSTLPAATPKAVSKEDRASLAKYNQTIEINPKDANAYVDRGVLKASKLNDTSGALADCDRAIQIDPNHAKAYLIRGVLKTDKLNDMKGGLGDYNRAIQINPDYDAAYFVRGALKTETLNNTQGALGDYNRAIKINSDYANAYVNRGFLKTNKLNDGQGALADYNRAIKIDPKHTNAYRNRGILKEYKLNNISAALADYNRAIQIDSNYADGYYNRGALKTNKLNDSQGALADFDQAIQLNPNFADFYIDRGALKTTKLNDTPGALADFDRAIQIDPKNANAYMNRGVIKYTKLNDLQGSLADYNRAIELNPNNADTHNNLAFVKYDLGDLSGAIQFWRKALTLNTKDADAQLGLAVALYKQGQEAEVYTLGTIAIRAEKRSTDLAFLKKEKIWSENILKDAATFFQTPTMSAIR